MQQRVQFEINSTLGIMFMNFAKVEQAAKASPILQNF